MQLSSKEDKSRIYITHRRSQRSFKLSANYDQRLDAKASSTGLRRHWILKAAKGAHKVCDLCISGSLYHRGNGLTMENACMIMYGNACRYK